MMTLRTSLSAEQIASLEMGLPDLAEWSADLLVPFSVCRLRNAHVLWVNRRWLLERGVNVMDQNTRHAVDTWLLETFAYVTAEDPNIPTDAISPQDTRIFFADRYGSSNGLSPHGGSGRVATVGRFQSKGVGPTPLVSAQAPRDYAHGYASIDEGIREAIYAEIASAEFPYGALPIIAILDTGLLYPATMQPSEGPRHSGRALLIRPSVLRPAHAERAPTFIRSMSGHEGDQRADVHRTRDVVKGWMTNDALASPEDVLTEHFRRAMRQISFGQAQRISFGGYYTSNIALDGSLLDFGNMHAFTNWIESRVLVNTQGLGKEQTMARRAMTSLAFYAKKYAGHPGSDCNTAKISKLSDEYYQRAVDADLDALLQLQEETITENLREVIRNILRTYYKDQQTSRAIYKFGRIKQGAGERTSQAWLYYALTKERAEKGVSAEDQVWGAVDQAIDESTLAIDGKNYVKRLMLGTAARLLKPRYRIDRRTLMDHISDTLTHLKGREDRSGGVATLIDEAIGSSRRHWHALPKGLVVLEQWVSEGSSLLRCANAQEGTIAWWVEGITSPEGQWFFGEKWPPDDAIHRDLRVAGPRWSALWPEESKRGHWLRQWSLARGHAMEIYEVAQAVWGQINSPLLSQLAR